MYLRNYIILFLLLGGRIFAQTTESGNEPLYRLEELTVSSTKETNELQTLPGSISFITPRTVEERRISSIVDLSTLIPNFFIPSYGSRMSTPVYIRGIGERSTGQSIGLYVDNMPYLDKSVFNFNLLDVQRIEVLRGPQGTLYGRNAMSGIVNIFTHSPLYSERVKATLTAGNYGLFRANASISRMAGRKAGVSLSGYYDRNSGFFENKYSGERADELMSAGGRLRMDVKPAEHWTVQLTANYDYSGQGAFPYGKFTDGEIAAPEYDHNGTYVRKMAGSNVHLEYGNGRILFSSSTGLQHFDDDMQMDLDYTPQSVFTINQKQKELNWMQEFTVKSNTENNYRWSFGAFGFNHSLRTKVETDMKEGAVQGVLQPMFDNISENNPNAPKFKITDSKISIPGVFQTPAYGGAFFHQSTYNNLFINNLSLTAGIRLDYERTTLDYNTSAAMNVNVTPPYGPPVPVPYSISTSPVGSGSMEFTEWLPKLAMKYTLDSERYIYVSAAKGYKAGGYNIQMFADIVQGIMMEKGKNRLPEIGQEMSDSILTRVSYRPEYSWNYELGFKGELIADVLYSELAVFYVDVRDVLITQFVSSGQGRLLKNAGRAASTGVDAVLTAWPTRGLTLSANYGYAHAILKDYKTDEADYSGNYIPFAPQHTFSASAGYTRRWHKRTDRDRFIGVQLFDRFNINAQYNGAGKIYWTETNDVRQDYYGLLNLKAGVASDIFSVHVWAKNLLNTDYATFYFETETQGLAQRGAPFQMGIDLTVSF